MDDVWAEELVEAGSLAVLEIVVCLKGRRSSRAQN
jgi:hypothetical protein